MIMKSTKGYFTAAFLGPLLFAGCASSDVADASRPHRRRVVEDSQSSSGSSAADFDTAQSLMREAEQRNDEAAANDEYRAQLQQINQDSGS